MPCKICGKKCEEGGLNHYWLYHSNQMRLGIKLGIRKSTMKYKRGPYAETRI